MSALAPNTRRYGHGSRLVGSVLQSGRWPFHDHVVLGDESRDKFKYDPAQDAHMHNSLTLKQRTVRLIQSLVLRRTRRIWHSKEETMKRAALILVFGVLGARAELMAAQCSSYYISEINLVTMVDAEPGNVQTFVGFGLSKEESEKNAVGACSHVRFDLETCLDSDRTSSVNAFFDSTDNSLHLKYRKAVKRVTGCS